MTFRRYDKSFNLVKTDPQDIYLINEYMQYLGDSFFLVRTQLSGNRHYKIIKISPNGDVADVKILETYSPVENVYKEGLTTDGKHYYRFGSTSFLIDFSVRKTFYIEQFDKSWNLIHEFFIREYDTFYDNVGDARGLCFNGKDFIGIDNINFIYVMKLGIGGGKGGSCLIRQISGPNPKGAIQDIMFDGKQYWITYNDGSSQSHVVQLDNNFNIIKDNEILEKIMWGITTDGKYLLIDNSSEKS